MKRIAIVGGGIAGLAAAYELERARKRGVEIDWHLYEAGDRLGGLVSTTRIDTPAGRFVLEDGPDGWVTDKPWANDLALELGLADQIIPCNESQRRTYIAHGGELLPMPDRMRMMVPEDLSTLEGCALFTEEARAAYAIELERAEELKASAPNEDESVANFVLRHFGKEALNKIGAPLLGGVFGGDAHKLSVRAVMPQFVAMEREFGSLIAGLQARAKERGNKPQQPVFTSLRNGMGTLAETLVEKLPAERLHLNEPALSLKREGSQWCLRSGRPRENGAAGKAKKHFHHVMLATSPDVTRDLLKPVDERAAALLPTDASSALLVTFAWLKKDATKYVDLTNHIFGERELRPVVPPGFGVLVPPLGQVKISPPGMFIKWKNKYNDPIVQAFNRGRPGAPPFMIATTFADQKYPHRAPEDSLILRGFFGNGSVEFFADKSDEEVARETVLQFESLLGWSVPDPVLTTVRRWPRSLPQYEVGHLERMAQLDERIAQLGGLSLLGNGYRGVGVPDLIRDARKAARELCVTS